MKTTFKHLLAACCLTGVLLLLFGTGQALTGDDSCSTVVTTTADTGAGSLREAINCSNSTAGRDTISFNIPGAGVKNIVLATPLPAVTDPAIIDGYTQPGSSANTLATGSNAVLQIVVNASATTGSVLDLVGAGSAAGSGSVVRGLVPSLAATPAVLHWEVPAGTRLKALSLEPMLPARRALPAPIWESARFPTITLLEVQRRPRAT